MNMIKNAKKRIAVGAALTMATAGLVSVGLSTPASAVTCNKTVNASVSGGRPAGPPAAPAAICASPAG